jgi:hypothetical protein
VSETRAILADVIADRAPSFGDAVRDLRTGILFTAEIEEVADIESNMLLGRDARESVIFHVSDRAAAAGIDQDDTLSAIGATFSVLRRTDNPASPQVDFGAMKITEKDGRVTS